MLSEYNICLDGERGNFIMSHLYWSTTPLSIILILVNFIFQNIYQNSDEDTNETKPKRSISIEINPENKNHIVMVIIGIFLILFVPIVNLLIALGISFSTISEYLKTRYK